MKQLLSVIAIALFAISAYAQDIETPRRDYNMRTLLGPNTEHGISLPVP